MLPSNFPGREAHAKRDFSPAKQATPRARRPTTLVGLLAPRNRIMCRARGRLRGVEALEARQLLSAGWELQSYDDAGSRFYPESSQVDTGTTPFVSHFSVAANWSGIGVPALTGDLYGDGKPDLVVGNGNDVDIYDASGDLVKTLSGVGHLDILADVTGGGVPDILVDYTDPTNQTISIRAYDGNGALVNAYSLPAEAPDAFLFAANVADLFGDGHMEVVAAVGSLTSISPRGIAIFDAQSGELLNYYDEAAVASNITIGDIYHDGRQELVFGNWGQWTGQDGWDGTRDDSSYIWALDAEAQLLWRQGPLASGPDNYGRQFDASTDSWALGPAYVSAANNNDRTSTGFNDSSALMDDFFGDGNLEVAASNSTDFSNANSYLNLLASNPSLPRYPTLPNFVGGLALLNPATGAEFPGYYHNFGGPVRVLADADLGSNGTKELLVSQFNPNTAHWFIDAVSPTTGLPVAASFDLGAVTSSAPSPTIAVCDVTGSGSPEIIVGMGEKLYVLNNDLQPLWSWDAGSGQVLVDSIVTDLGDDGRIEIIATSYNPSAASTGSIPVTVNVLAPPQGGAPVAIPPDQFKGTNNSQATAADLGPAQGPLEGVDQVTGLTIYQSGQDEWFKFQTAGPSTQDNLVGIQFDSATGILDLEVTDSSGNPVGTVVAGTDVEAVSLLGLPAGEYYVQVSGHDGATSPGYQLIIDAPGGSDNSSPNDTLDTATDLNPPNPSETGQDNPLTGSKTVPNLAIAAGTDVNYFKFTTAAVGGDGDSVQLTYDNTQAGLDLQLLDASGNLLETDSPAQGDPETISLSGLAAATYYVEVKSDAGAPNSDYSLTVNAPAASGTNLPPDWTGGTHTSLALALDLGPIQGTDMPVTNLSINESGVDEWFKFGTSAAGGVADSVRIDFTSAQGALGLELDDASGTVLYSSSGPTDFQQISLSGLAAGTYYIRVFGIGGATNPDYTLTINGPAAPVTTIQPDQYGGHNNTQASAYDLGTVQNQQQLKGLSIYQSGNDEWFKFEVANAGDLTVRIDFSYAQGGLNLSVVAPGGATTLSDTTDDFQQVELTGAQAGTYYIHVAGYDGATNPNYTLTINAPVATITPDWAEPNNTQATAYNLGPVQGQQQWPNQQQGAPLSIYQSGKDEWFAFTTAASATQGDQVAIDFNSSLGALNLQVTNQSGNPLGQSISTSAGLTVSLAGLAAGTYYVHVFGVNGATNPSYSLLISAPAATSTAAQWNVLFYGDGENNLDSLLAYTIQTMEEVQTPQQVNLGVIWGRSPTSPWGGDTLQGWLTYNPDSQYGDPSSQLSDLGDTDMGTEANLQNFLVTMMEERPATHYMLILKDHGNAWDGAEVDSATGNIISSAGIEQAIAAAEAQTGQRINVLAFDTCLDATFETDYEFRNSVDYVVASEPETIVGGQNPDGSFFAGTVDYQSFLNDLAQNPSLTPAQVASTMVATMTPEYTQGMAATSTSEYGNLASSLNAFAQVAMADTGDAQSIADARDQAKVFDGAYDDPTINYVDQNDRDLGDFMTYLADNRSVEAALSAAAQNVLNALSNTVIATNPGGPGNSGFSTFLPAPGDETPFGPTLDNYSPSDFDLFSSPGSPSGSTPWFQFAFSLAELTSQSAAAGTNTGVQFSAQAKALPLHALAGSWQVGTFALDSSAEQNWFQFQTLGSGGSSNNVTITFSNAQGDLTLTLDNAGGTVLQTSTTTNGVEKVSLDGLAAASYYLLVSGPQGNPGYTLTINAPSVPQPDQDWTGANYSLPKAYDPKAP